VSQLGENVQIFRILDDELRYEELTKHRDESVAQEIVKDYDLEVEVMLDVEQANEK
jgi:hypothetical protein